MVDKCIVYSLSSIRGTQSKIHLRIRHQTTCLQALPTIQLFARYPAPTRNPILARHSAHHQNSYLLSIQFLFTI